MNDIDKPQPRPKPPTTVPSPRNPSAREPRSMWKKVVGWILFVWGAGGFIGDMVFIGRLKSNPSTLVPNLIFCALFMWGGWMLTHSKKEKHK